jgi:hypothetical protein
MKITKEKLKRLIKEELDNLTEVATVGDTVSAIKRGTGETGLKQQARATTTGGLEAERPDINMVTNLTNKLQAVAALPGPMESEPGMRAALTKLLAAIETALKEKGQEERPAGP